MGCGPSYQYDSEAENSINHEIEKYTTKCYRESNDIYKLLLLGTGESGKSTFLKQIIQLYGKGFDDIESRKKYISQIYNNILFNIKTLLHASQELSLSHPHLNTNSEPELTQDIKFILSLDNSCNLNPVYGDMIQRIWEDPGIQTCYNNRNLFQLNDNTEYYLNQIAHISRTSYIPSIQDILRTRVRTTGIIEAEFMIDNHKLFIIDVGGQRNERKKWIHCFENVTAVIFLVSLSEYDMFLFEDSHVNRLDESLSLFEEICNNQWLSKTNIILFLNKSDLFYEKIKTIPFTWQSPKLRSLETNPETIKDYHTALNYIENQFQKSVSYRDIYCHVTCCMDTSNISVVFNSVKEILFRKALMSSGLM